MKNERECGNGIGNAAIGKNADACIAERQSAISVLRERADRLRRDAGSLHEEANRVEQLANVMAGINGPAEEALYRLVMDSMFGRPPRAF